MFTVTFRLLVTTALLLVAPASGSLADKLPIIDAHSQADHLIDLEDIIGLMDDAGVTRTILSLRGRRNPEDLIAFAGRHPDRITPAVRTKGQNVRQVKQQVKTRAYGAMAEVLMWHREKKKQRVTTATGKTMAPPQVVMPPDHQKAQNLLKIARKWKWPFIPHIEFASAGDDYAPFMAKLEDQMRRHPDHPFVLIHMGMLNFKEVKRLIEAHPNVHFIPAHSDPLSVTKYDAPFTEMFRGLILAPQWKDLIIRHKDRFIIGFDMVWSHEWEKFYLDEVNHWRDALADLPEDVAHAVAHRNAERLWRLPPAQ